MGAGLIRAEDRLILDARATLPYTLAVAENEWSRRARAAFGVWSIVSAMSSTLITGYKFLSAHSHLVPTASQDVGVVTLVVNACLFAALLCFTGFFSGLLFTYLVGKDKLLPTLLKLAALIFVGLVFLFPHSLGGAPAGSPVEPGWTLFGVICLVCVVLRLSPMAQWVVENDMPALVVAGSILTLLGLMFPSFIQFLWTSWSERKDFSMVPLSSMSFNLWVVAVMGGGIYAWAYLEFQAWRKKGDTEAE